MATLQILGDDELFPLNESHIGIGRAPDNEIVIEDHSVSGYHALITAQPASVVDLPDEFYVEDLDSTNKTYVNNKEVTRQRLKEGDIVRVGETRLKFSSKQHVEERIDFEKTTKLSANKLLRLRMNKP
jgi:pSer/pThr/pTyr-binding forkhead associated (FHA) protein